MGRENVEEGPGDYSQVWRGKALYKSRAVELSCVRCARTQGFNLGDGIRYSASNSQVPGR